MAAERIRRFKRVCYLRIAETVSRVAAVFVRSATRAGLTGNVTEAGLCTCGQTHEVTLGRVPLRVRRRLRRTKYASRWSGPEQLRIWISRTRGEL